MSSDNEHDLFADCANGDHDECLRTFPEFDLESDPPQRTGNVLTCACKCHTCLLCPKDGYVLQLLAADEPMGCGYWCPSCESTYEEGDSRLITESEAEG